MTPTSSSGCRPTCATTASAPRSWSTWVSPASILTNNPKKILGLEGYRLSVTDQVPIQAVPNPHNEAYLRAKRERLGHALHHQGLPLDEQLIYEEHRKDQENRREAGRGEAATARERDYPPGD